MSRTPTVSPKAKRAPAAPKDPQAIAQGIVERRFAAFAGDLEDFLLPQSLPDFDDEEAGRGFDELLKAVADQEMTGNPAYWKELDVEDLPYNHQRIGAAAGFLVGLELGRRLGGAR